MICKKKKTLDKKLKFIASGGRKKDEEEPVNCAVVCEILDSRTQETISKNEKVSLSSDFVQSNQMVSQILAMVSEDRNVKTILGQLLGASGTALSVAGNWCGDDVQGMVRCSRVLARHLPKTQLTHLNISGVGLGCNGVAAIGTALRRASGADDVIAIERNHQEEMKRLLGVLQAEENREKLAIRKLQQIREYVSSEKKK